MRLVADEGDDVGALRLALVKGALESEKSFTYRSDGGYLTGESLVFGAMIQDASFHGSLEFLPDDIVGGYLGLGFAGPNGWKGCAPHRPQELMANALGNTYYGLLDLENPMDTARSFFLLFAKEPTVYVTRGETYPRLSDATFEWGMVAHDHRRVAALCLMGED